MSSINAISSVSLDASVGSASVNTNTGEPLSLALTARIVAPMLGSGQSPPPLALRLRIAFKNSLIFVVMNISPSSIDL